jgi:hypothetical protein
LIGSAFLILVDLVRLATLDMTILFAPLGIMALANTSTRSFGKFWASLFVQPIQTAVMALGVALAINLGHLNPNDQHSASPISEVRISLVWPIWDMHR